MGGIIIEGLAIVWALGKFFMVFMFVCFFPKQTHTHNGKNALNVLDSQEVAHFHMDKICNTILKDS